MAVSEPRICAGLEFFGVQLEKQGIMSTLRNFLRMAVLSRFGNTNNENNDSKAICSVLGLARSRGSQDYCWITQATKAVVSGPSTKF